jgi:hypothetical protein
MMVVMVIMVIMVAAANGNGAADLKLQQHFTNTL